MTTAEVWDAESGCWEPVDLDAPVPSTVVPPHAVPELIGFELHRGVSVAPLGEDDDAYLVLGCDDPRRALAAATRWARVNYLQRYRDVRWLEVSQRWATFTVPVGKACGWYVDYVGPDTPGAVAVTLVTGLEGLEEFVQPSRCPRCGRMSMTGRRMNRERWPVGSTGLAHKCSCSEWCVWPAERQTTTA